VERRCTPLATTETTRTVKTRVPEPLAPREVALILNAIGDGATSPEVLRRRVIHETLHKTGLRASELLDLRPEDVHSDEPHPYIRVRCGKGGKQRHVPISQALDPWLRKWADARPAGGEWFFCRVRKHTAGSRMADDELRTMVRRAGETAGVPGVHPHKWRHTYATELLAEGCTIREVQMCMGHASIATTQVYLHVRPEELWRHVNKAQEATAPAAGIEALAAQAAPGTLLATLKALVAQMEGTAGE
jgi:site-specific recombinase XerD